MKEDSSKKFLVSLVAEAVAINPTGYHVSFHSPDSVIPFSPDLLYEGDYACTPLAKDLVLVKKKSPTSGVTNMICSYLTGENFYSDVTFLAFDPDTRLLTLPTLEQLAPIMTLAYIKFDESAPGAVVFTDPDDFSEDDVDDFDEDAPLYPVQDFTPSCISSKPLDLKADLILG